MSEIQRGHAGLTSLTVTVHFTLKEKQTRFYVFWDTYCDIYVLSTAE